jgi:hypothetical protein
MILFLSFFPTLAFSQGFRGESGDKTYFVEIKNDSALVEAYYYKRPDFVIKYFDAIVALNDKNSENKVQLLKKGLQYVLEVRKPNSTQFEKVRLKSDESRSGRILRNNSYSSEKRMLVGKLADSLSGPQEYIRVDVHNTYRKIDNHLEENDYKARVDNITDSLTAEIHRLKSPSIDSIYQKFDAVAQLDSAVIVSFLSTEEYRHHYSRHILHNIAIERPELLIAYLDTKPSNKKRILSSIKYSPRLEEITRSVKNTELSSKGKKKIIRQKSNRTMGDILAGAAYATIVLAEVAGLVALGVWIF